MAGAQGMKTYRFEDGKYEIDRDADNGLIQAARRHGEPWQAFMDLRFSKVVHCMLDRIDHLEKALSQYEHPISQDPPSIGIYQVRDDEDPPGEWWSCQWDGRDWRTIVNNRPSQCITWNGKNTVWRVKQ